LKKLVLDLNNAITRALRWKNQLDL
jgi:hypothetical protein